MPNDDALFDMSAETSSVASEGPLPIRRHQIEEIRNAFAIAGIVEMEQRRRFIEECVQRSVPSLANLHAKDVRFIVDRLKARAQVKGGGGSAWDEREVDTWIDRL